MWGPQLHLHNSAGISIDSITVAANYSPHAYVGPRFLTSIPFIQRLAMMESSPQTMMWNSKKKTTQVKPQRSFPCKLCRCINPAAQSLTLVESLIQVLDLFKVTACFGLGSCCFKKCEKTVHF